MQLVKIYTTSSIVAKEVEDKGPRGSRAMVEWYIHVNYMVSIIKMNIIIKYSSCGYKNSITHFWWVSQGD